MMSAPSVTPHSYLRAQVRWHPLEYLFWLATILPFFVFPNYLSLASQIAITALFALSLDLILGYAGIVSLGHAAFFGIGAYTAGIISKHGYGDPTFGLLARGAGDRLVRPIHQLHRFALQASGADHDHAGAGLPGA